MADQEYLPHLDMDSEAEDIMYPFSDDDDDDPDPFWGGFNDSSSDDEDDEEPPFELFAFHFLLMNPHLMHVIHNVVSNMNQQVHEERKEMMDSLPRVIWSSATGAKETSCAICLSDFEQTEELKRLPCNHHFHGVCIDPWLLQQPVCPLCKQDVGNTAQEMKAMIQKRKKEEKQRKKDQQKKKKDEEKLKKKLEQQKRREEQIKRKKEKDNKLCLSKQEEKTNSLTVQTPPTTVDLEKEEEEIELISKSRKTRSKSRTDTQSGLNSSKPKRKTSDQLIMEEQETINKRDQRRKKQKTENQ